MILPAASGLANMAVRISLDDARFVVVRTNRCHPDFEPTRAEPGCMVGSCALPKSRAPRPPASANNAVRKDEPSDAFVVQTAALQSRNLTAYSGGSNI